MELLVYSCTHQTVCVYKVKSYGGVSDNIIYSTMILASYNKVYNGGLRLQQKYNFFQFVWRYLRKYPVKSRKPTINWRKSEFPHNRFCHLTAQWQSVGQLFQKKIAVRYNKSIDIAVHTNPNRPTEFIWDDMIVYFITQKSPTESRRLWDTMVVATDDLTGKHTVEDFLWRFDLMKMTISINHQFKSGKLKPNPNWIVIVLIPNKHRRYNAHCVMNTKCHQIYQCPSMFHVQSSSHRSETTTDACPVNGISRNYNLIK